MADLRISALPAVTAPALTHEFGVNESGTSKKMTLAQILGGIAGGSSLTGGTASGDDLTLQSTSDATKGAIIFGASRYDEVADRLIVGHTAGIQSDGVTPAVQVQGNTDSTAALSVANWENSAAGPRLQLVKSRGATIGTNVIVQNDDDIAVISFVVDDGTDLESVAAEIKVAVDGVPALDDTPGRIVFMTTAAGAQVATERMRLDSPGNLLVGGTASPASAVGALVLFNGTAPSAAAVDSVAVYSVDDIAGHTIPAFYCEGSNVLATGQADIASTRRVKMKINGTTVTLLAE